MTKRNWSNDIALMAFVIVGWAFAIYGVGRLAQGFGYPAWWQ